MHNWEELLAWKRNKILHTEREIGFAWPSMVTARFPRQIRAIQLLDNLSNIFQPRVCVCVSLSNDPKVDSEHANERNKLFINLF